MPKRILSALAACLLLVTAAAPLGVTAEDTYTNMTDTLGLKDRSDIGSYLTRFGACYKATDSPKRYVFTDGWSDDMSEIIWWQFLSYSLRDRLSPNASLAGNEKIITYDILQSAVRTTFGVEGIPDGVLSTNDQYFISYVGGTWQAPQQSGTGTMWTRSPENCKIQYFCSLPDGRFLVHYTLEYLQDATGTYGSTTYYAILKKADTRYGYIADELGQTAVLPDEYKNAGFLDAAKSGCLTKSNLEFDYEKVREFSGLDNYKNDLKEKLDGLNGTAPTGPAVNDIAVFIEAACTRLATVRVSAENNFVELNHDKIEAAATTASEVSKTLWGLAEEYSVTPNYQTVVPLQVIIQNLNEDSAPIIKLDRQLYSELQDANEVRILLGDNRHGIAFSKAELDAVSDSYGSMGIQYGSAKGGGIILNFFNENGNEIEKLPVRPEFAIPAEDRLETVFYTHANGKEFNIGGQYDSMNQTLEFRTAYPGRFRTKLNVKDITDIGQLSGETQDQIRYLVSKDLLAVVGGQFEPEEQYSKYDAAQAVSGMLFVRDPEAQTSYIDLTETDPQYLTVASVDQAGLDLYPENESKKFGGISAVGLEAAFAKSLALLEPHQGYFYPKGSNDRQLPYQSPYLNFPDISYLNAAYLEELALGVREGIVEDGKALFAQDNQLSREDAAAFLYRLNEHLNPVAPMAFQADGQFASSTERFKPRAPESFDIPVIVWMYVGCFLVGLFGYFIMKMKKKKS